mgnify:CR=1 FL=1
MKKPKWRVTPKFIKFSTYGIIPRVSRVKNLLWKDKFDTPRVERIPCFYIAWLIFQLSIEQGHDCEWEWYLWVTKYSADDENMAKATWPWYSNTDGLLSKSEPWLTYNK